MTPPSRLHPATSVLRVLCTGLLCLLASFPGLADDGTLSIETLDIEGGKRLVAINHSLAPQTLRMEISGQNIQTTPRGPILTVVPAGGQKTIADIRPARRNDGYSYRYRYLFLTGTLNAGHDAGASYRLPYPDGLGFFISQAFGGEMFTHHGPDSAHAIDFVMPEGTLVLAARGGRVIKVVQHFTTGGQDAWHMDKANQVQVLHDDGTIALYVHLAPYSALVQVGDRVQTGSLLARSGNTGYSSGPHLHFAVTRVVQERNGTLGTESLPVVFHTTHPPDRFTARQGMFAQAQYGQAPLALHDTPHPASRPAPPTTALAHVPDTVAPTAAFLPAEPAGRPDSPHLPELAPDSPPNRLPWLSLGILLLAWLLIRRSR